MKLTMNEADKLIDAFDIAEETIEKIKGLEHSARMGSEIDDHELWELKNFSEQIGAILYNIHHGVYRPSQAPSGHTEPEETCEGCRDK